MYVHCFIKANKQGDEHLIDKGMGVEWVWFIQQTMLFAPTAANVSTLLPRLPAYLSSRYSPSRRYYYFVHFVSQSKLPVENNYFLDIGQHSRA